jgi:alkanesulfonate monooxygenase SsuD/methylene tetrahydromethanopterin reductase-like flavin-dependent oxidoreductase (luciferase family)
MRFVRSFAFIGNAEEIREQLAELESAGATELNATISGNADERAATFELLSSIARGN